MLAISVISYIHPIHSLWWHDSLRPVDEHRAVVITVQRYLIFFTPLWALFARRASSSSSLSTSSIESISRPGKKLETKPPHCRHPNLRFVSGMQQHTEIYTRVAVVLFINAVCKIGDDESTAADGLYEGNAVDLWWAPLTVLLPERMGARWAPQPEISIEVNRWAPRFRRRPG